MVADAGSASSPSSRARTGSSDTSAAAGSPITATSSMGATLVPSIFVVKTMKVVSGTGMDAAAILEHTFEQGVAMSADADHEVIDSPGALFRHLYEEHGVEEARDLDPETAPLQFWLRRHAELERAGRPGWPGPRRAAAARRVRGPAGRGHGQGPGRPWLRRDDRALGHPLLHRQRPRPLRRGGRPIGAGRADAPGRRRAPARRPQVHPPGPRPAPPGPPRAPGRPPPAPAAPARPPDPEPSPPPRREEPARPEAAWAVLWADLADSGRRPGDRAGAPGDDGDDLMAVANAVHAPRRVRLLRR